MSDSWPWGDLGRGNIGLVYESLIKKTVRYLISGLIVFCIRGTPAKKSHLLSLGTSPGMG